MDWLVYALYRFLAVPSALFFLQLFSRFLPPKIQEMLADRASQNLQVLPARPIWIHASSGEIEYAKSVVRSLKEQFPQVPVLVTYFSPSAKKLIQKFPGIDLAMALPWDRPQDITRFLNFYNPRVFLVARTDVWPEVSRQVRKRNIPSALFAATFAKQSSRKGLLSGSLSRLALNSLSLIRCVSEEDQENLLALGVQTPIEVSGDTRFDQVLFRLQNPNPIWAPFKPSAGEKIFVCGSTWPEDEEILIEAFDFWLQNGGRIILAPHEISSAHLNSLENTLKERGWSYQKYTDQQNSWNSQVLLVNQVGCLQELYSWGTLAFVGGSFKGKVHSVMEPLCVGLPVAVGPHHHNNREALAFQHVILGTGYFAVNEIRNARDLKSLMTMNLMSPSPHPLILEKVREASGATEELLSWVTAAICPSSKL